ncbi:MAG: FkbM family methyltransferase [Pseudomonadota bacterium]
MSNRYMLQLRRVARAAGVPRLLGRLAKDYESSFSRQLTLACRPGDVVWDVGANVGYYSRNFSQWVGASGKVFAFEPDMMNLPELRAACSGSRNVEIREFGLSDKTERRRFLEGDDADRSTSRVLVPGEAVPDGTTEVELQTGDAVIQGGNAEPPNVIKIDVEGHELSVLRGMQGTLSSERLRSVFVEVHFGILDRSGRADDPKKIEDILKRSGFKISWTDASHIFASRPV